VRTGGKKEGEEGKGRGPPKGWLTPPMSKILKIACLEIKSLHTLLISSLESTAENVFISDSVHGSLLTKRHSAVGRVEEGMLGRLLKDGNTPLGSKLTT